MRFIVLNLKGERAKNQKGKSVHKKPLGKLDSIEIDAVELNVKKGYRLLYQDKVTKRWYEFVVTAIDEGHDESGVSYNIYAENSLIDLDGVFIGDRRGVNVSGSVAIEKVTDGTHWQGFSEDIGSGTFNFYRTSAYEALGSVLKAFPGVEFETRIEVKPGYKIERKIYLKKQIGSDNGKRFTYKKDMTKVSRKVGEEPVITRLYPFGKGEQTGNGYGRRIGIESVNGGKLYIDNLEAQQQYGYENKPYSGTKIYDDVDDPGKLLEIAKEDLKQLSKPTITYGASVIDLKSYGYDFKGVDVGDVVVLRDKVLDLTLKGRVSELVVDLDEEEETKISLGYIRPTISKFLNSVTSTLDRITAKEALLDDLADHESFIDRVISGLNDGFKNAQSYMSFSKEQGLIFTDNPDHKLARWAINIGSMGFRIADGKNSDGSWKWRTFGTGEGFTADLIRSGTIIADLIKAGVLSDTKGENYWDMNSGSISIGGGALSYNKTDGFKIKVVDDLRKDVDTAITEKADKSKIISEINASREGINISGDRITLNGSTEVMGSFKVSGDALFGTINANRIDVENLSANNITSGVLSRGVNNRSCYLPESGSASLSGSGTQFDTGSSAFQFDYGQNTFFVKGRLTATPGTEYNHSWHALEINGLTLSTSDGTRVVLKCWGDSIKFDANRKIVVPTTMNINRLEIQGTDVTSRILNLK